MLDQTQSRSEKPAAESIKSAEPNIIEKLWSENLWQDAKQLIEENSKTATGYTVAAISLGAGVFACRGRLFGTGLKRVAGFLPDSELSAMEGMTSQTLIHKSIASLPDSLKFAESSLGPVSAAKLLKIGQEPAIAFAHARGASLVLPQSLTRGSIRAITESHDGKIALQMTDDAVFKMTGNDLQMLLPKRASLAKEGAELKVDTWRGKTVQIGQQSERIWQGKIDGVDIQTKATRSINLDSGLTFSSIFVPAKEIAGLSKQARIAAFRSGSIYSRNYVGVGISEAGSRTEIVSSLYGGAGRPSFFKLSREAALPDSSKPVSTQLQALAYLREPAHNAAFKPTKPQELTVNLKRFDHNSGQINAQLLAVLKGEKLLVPVRNSQGGETLQTLAEILAKP